MSTKKCPMCAEEIQAEALVCRYCGTRFSAGPEGDVPGAPPPPPAPPAAAAAPGEVREGLVATGRQAFGWYLHSLAAAALLVVVALAYGGMRSLGWAERPSGLFLEMARPAPVFLVGAIVVVFVWALGVRRLFPRQRDVGREVVRRYARTLKEQHGISLLLSRRGLVGGVIAVVVIWALMEASAVYNFVRIGEEEWTVRAGIYFALALPALGALAALLVLPGRGVRRVHMDSRGTILG